MIPELDDVVTLANGRCGIVIGIDGHRFRVLIFDVMPAEVVDAAPADIVAITRPERSA